VANVLFGIGTLICGLATSQGMVVSGRVIAGMGGGALNAISTFVASDIIPLRQRGLWQGIGNLFWGLGSSLGGLYGGYIDGVWGWRWAFLTQMPMILISLLLVIFRVKLPPRGTEPPSIKRIDFLGAVTLVLTLVLLLFGLNAGGNTVPWGHPLVIVSLSLSAVSLGVFIYVEDKFASEPIIPVRLLLDRTVAASCLINWLGTMATFTIIFYVPLYFQVVMGLSPAASGLQLVPQSVGTAIGSLGSGIIMRATAKYYWLNIAVGCLYIVAYSALAFVTRSTPSWQPLIYLTLSGVAYGSMLTVNLTALIASVKQSDQAVATSASYAFRSTGSAIGITIASAIFQNVLRARLWDVLGDHPDAAKLIEKLTENADLLKQLPPQLQGSVQDSYMEALRWVFIFAAGLTVISFSVCTTMKEHKLHSNLARK
jgi:MFS family permease